MLTASLLLGVLLLPGITAAGQSAALPEIVLAPRSGLGVPMPDVASIFTNMSQWYTVAKHTAIYSVAAQWFRFNSSNDINTLLRGLEANNIKLDIGAGMLTGDTCGSGVEGFNASDVLQAAQIIHDYGGTVYSITMDEPFYFGMLYGGMNACHWSAQQVAGNIAANLAGVRALFPNVVVGDAEPMALGQPSDWLTQYQSAANAYKAATGIPLAWMLADVQWGKSSWTLDVLGAEGAFKNAGIPFGIFYNGAAESSSDSAWVSSAQSHFASYENAGGRPAIADFASWDPYPQYIIPETDQTLTHVADLYLQSYGVTSPAVISLDANGQNSLTITQGDIYALNWSSSDASSCEIAFVDTNGNGTTFTLTPNTSGTGSYTAAGTFTMTCVGNNGDTVSKTLSVTATDSLAPTASLSQSQDLTTSDGTTGQTFTVSWTSTNATACTVQKQTPNGTTVPSWGTGTSGSQNASPWQIGTHHWWIDCTGPGGTAHQDMYHTVVSSPTPPPAPSALVATCASNTGTLWWGASSGATSYQLYAKDNNSAVVLVNQGVGSVTSYSIPGLYGASYSWTVAACNAGGCSTAMLGNAFSCQASPPNTTAKISESSIQTNANQTFTVSWSSGNATSCNIVKSTPGQADNSAWCSAGLGQCGTSGSQNASPFIIGTHTFTLTCKGPGGTATSAVSHKVISGPTASFTADGTHTETVPLGSSINFAWSSTGGVSAHTTVTVDSPDTCGNSTGTTWPWAQGNTLSGTFAGATAACQVGRTYTRTYTVTDSNNNTASDTTTVKVVAAGSGAGGDGSSSGTSASNNTSAQLAAISVALQAILKEISLLLQGH